VPATPRRISHAPVPHELLCAHDRLHAALEHKFFFGMSEVAMHLPAERAAGMTLIAASKRPRHADETHVPHASPPEHQAASKRIRLESLNSPTRSLLAQLERQMHESLAARARKDKMERSVSLKIALAHPLTFGGDRPSENRRSVSPYSAPVTSPMHDSCKTNAKETPCLAPKPIFQTPSTADKSAEVKVKAAFNHPGSPPVITI
jgi:hypothetical protein